MTSLKVERVVVDPPEGNDFLQVGDPECDTTLESCCGVSANCLPAGVSGLRIERTTFDMPEGARLEREWCEYVSVCCVGSGSASGSGQCQSCCSDVSPFYLHSTNCCSTPLPNYITPAFTGPCRELNNANWSTSLFWVGALPGYPDGCWIVQNGGGDPHVIALIMYCDSSTHPPTLKLDVRCGDTTSTSPVWFTIPLTVDSCCPFAAHGRAIAPSSDCCVGGHSVAVSLFAPAGDRSNDQSSGGGDGSCLVLVTFQEWSFPEGTTVSSPICETDPPCCESDITAAPCEGEAHPCNVTLPRRLYGTLLNVTGPAAAFLEGFTFPLESGATAFWGIPHDGCAFSAALNSIYRFVVCGSESTATAENVGMDLLACRRSDRIEWQAAVSVQRVRPSTHTGEDPTKCYESQAPDDVTCLQGGNFTSPLFNLATTPCSRPVLIVFPGLHMVAGGANPTYPSFTCDLVVTE